MDAQVGRVDVAGRDQPRAERGEAGAVLPTEPVGADLGHVAAEDLVAGGEVVGDRVRGDVVEGVVAVHPGRLAADHRGELELPVELLRPGRDHDVVVRPGHRGRQADEQVRRPLGGAAVHQLRDLGADLGVRPGAALGVVRGGEVDDVGAVVRARLQDLPGGERGVDVQVVERLGGAGPRGVGAHRVQQGQHAVPVGEQRRRRDRIGQADHRPVELDDARLRDEPGEAAPVPGTRERPHPDHQ